jgi:hypothetical protein
MQHGDRLTQPDSGSRAASPFLYDKLGFAMLHVLLFCESLLAFSGCIGYPRALTAFFDQGYV